jgi:hypothetical protein
MIWLEVIPGTIEATSQGLSFRCSGGENAVTCSITEQALDDLIQYHRLDVNKDETFASILSEIERIANEKFGAARLEKNGELIIRTIDVLRYGFQNTDDSAAP